MSPGVWQIGSIQLHPAGDLSPFKHLFVQPPVAASDQVRPVRFSVELCNAPDWPIAIETTASHYRKGLPSHEVSIDFADRRLNFRIVSPIDAIGRYMIYRDFFCALGGLAGEPLLHASAVIRDGGVHAFLAVSGGGKSTIAEMLRPHAAWLNDEIIWITAFENELLVVNQPFWRGEQEPTGRSLLPLAALYLIHKSEGCALRPMPPAGLYAMALGAPFGPDDPGLPDRARRTARLVEKTPCYHLDVPLDGNAVAETIFACQSKPS